MEQPATKIEIASPPHYRAAEAHAYSRRVIGEGRMLIAPAGYGKTTLAEQWTAVEAEAPPGTRVGPPRPTWPFFRSASREAAVELLPGCDGRIRERVRATRNPAAEVDLLAELLAEDFAGWPTDAWLVIDDYQFVCRHPRGRAVRRDPSPA